MAVKILHFSTHNEDCGIGKYQEMFVQAMLTDSRVENAFFSVSPNKIRTMSGAEKAEVFAQLLNELGDYDVLHIQHEFSFYPSEEFAEACKMAKQANKRLIVTVHTAPSVAYSLAQFAGLAPRSLLHFMRSKKRENFYTKYFAQPMQLADIVLVHNEVTKQGLVRVGVDAAKIVHITIPVPNTENSMVSTEIAEQLHRESGDIIYATTGFLHRYKGIDHAIKALKFLPSNYKLAIIGGMHQDHDHTIYNEITDLITQLSLNDRVYVTGYIEDDNRLNALIRECDICVYPYEKVYYSNVSSAALNNAYANEKPVIAYPTASFIELNDSKDYMKLTQAFSYYELSRELKWIDLKAAVESSILFKKRYGYSVVAKQLATVYTESVQLV